MLGVLKRRWKPKRPGGGGQGKSDSPIPGDGIDKARAPVCARQIHPASDEKKAAFPLAPNICVEGGRIEFVKPPPDPIPAVVHPVPDALAVKERLEARVAELERALEAEQRTGQRERLALERLHRQLQRREVVQRDVERERRLRAEAEARLRDSSGDLQRCRQRLTHLHAQCAKMEETVRTMLQYKSRSEQLKQEKTSLTVAYENRIHQFQNTIIKLNHENESLKKQLRSLEAAGAGDVQRALLDRLTALESDNSNLSRDAELQRRQYERCLDDVANQVVRALLSQKGLREEISGLQRRIKELETQNRALTAVLVQQLQTIGVATTPNMPTVTPDHTSNSLNMAVSPNGIPDSPLTSVTSISTPASDGSRPLWEEPLTVWLPLQRPRSLNLHLHSGTNALALAAKCCQHRKNRNTINPIPKKPVTAAAEEEGSESPESGNRDEGYSTMSSDVQGEAARPGETAVVERRGLEDVKEETDTALIALGTSSNVIVDTQSHLVVMEDACDPDVLFIPLGFTLGLSAGNPRHSFPPSKDLLPYQHIMRSFSDSHLCLKLTASTPSPIQHQSSSYSLSSTTSSSPSVLIFDPSQAHPLRRSKATSSLLDGRVGSAIPEEDESTSGDIVVEGCWWDADYVQHWLKLDETRSALQQQHRDLLELEYDQAELEDWSMTLSNEDITTPASGDSLHWRRSAPPSETPSQPSCGGLPSIQENNMLELEEDSSECLWNNASYMLDRAQREHMSLLEVDAGDQGNGNSEQKHCWPYNNANYSLASPGGSWSSNSEDCCHSFDCAYNGCNGGAGFDNSSKRSSAAMSGCSDDAVSSESPVIGIDFTRDFYRLVKFESTKSLASTSSRSLVGGLCVSETGGSLTRNKNSEFQQASLLAMPLSEDREQALQSVLNFIAEQQQYCTSREEQDLVKNASAPVKCPVEDTMQMLSMTKMEFVDDSAQQPLNSENVDTGESKDVNSTPSIHLENTECNTFSNEENSKNLSLVEKCLEPEGDEPCNSENIHNLEENLDYKTEARSEENIEEQIHTIIEINTVASPYIPLEENEVQDTSNKKEKSTEDMLNEHNSAIGSVLSQKYLLGLPEEHVVSFEEEKIENLKTLADKFSQKNEDKTFSLTSFEPSNHEVLNANSKLNQDIGDISVSENSSNIKEWKKDKTKKCSDSSNRVATNIESEDVKDDISLLSLPLGAVSLGHRLGEALVTVIEEDEQPSSLEASVSSSREMSESFTSTTISSPETVINRNLSQTNSSNVIVMDSSRTVSFHEKATSKDVIEELNRMIQKGDDCQAPSGSESDVTAAVSRLDIACCCQTGWVHVERDIDFTDPKARANLLDVMLASSGSSGGSSTSSSESGEEPADYQHLHRLHRFRRQKKASATREQLGVLRYAASSSRPSIIGRDDFFVRYGDKEREAVASFDFLEDLSTTSVSGASSCDTLGSRKLSHPGETTPTPTATPSSDDSDDKMGGQISFSDSCAASYSGSSNSLDIQEQ